MQFLANLKLFLAGVLLAGATFFNPSVSQPKLGVVSSFNPVQAAPTYLSGAGVTSNATSINLTSFVTRQGTAITTANLGGIGYATIDPGTTKEENISFTGVTQNSNGTAVLTGVTRGLQDVYPYTATSSLQIAHSGGATVITSNSGAFYSQFNIAANTSTITGNWTYASTSIPSMSSDTPTSSFTTYNLIDKQYADALAFAGTPNGSPTQKGIYQEATTSTIASGTVIGTTGADLTLTQATASTTSNAYNVVEGNGSGKIDGSWVSSQNYSLGSTTVQSLTSASTTLNGTTTVDGNTTFNVFPTVATTSPTSSLQLAPKGYVDTFASTIATGTVTGSLSSQNATTTNISTTTISVSNGQILTIALTGYLTEYASTACQSIYITVDGTAVSSFGSNITNFITLYGLSQATSTHTSTVNVVLSAGNGVNSCSISIASGNIYVTARK